MTKFILAVTATFAGLFAPLTSGFAGQQALLKSLNFEQSHGEVRVVLLRASQVVSTNKQLEFVVTYAVEVPTNGAFSDLHFSSSNEITIFVGGKAIECGSSNASMSFTDLPRQNELSKPNERPGKAMLAQESAFDGLKIDAKKIDVKFQFTWRGNNMLFDFKDVPLN